VLAAFEPLFATVVCTQNSTSRALPAHELAEVAEGLFGADRVEVAARLDDALDRAVTLAEASDSETIGLGSGGVLVTGSVITAGEARTLLGAGR
jgi:dihydrofolate synthase/folylpolyglutamate synthase